MPIEAFRRRAINTGALDDSRAMKEDVNRASIGQLSNDIAKLNIVRKVGRKARSPRTKATRLIRQLQSAPDEANINLLRRQRQGNRFSDPTAAARDDRSLFRQKIHRPYTSNC